MNMARRSFVFGVVTVAGLVAVVIAGNSIQAARAGHGVESEAEKIAAKILKAGSELFDAKKADALAATYTEDGKIHLFSKRDGKYQDDLKEGRADIARFYEDMFKDGGVHHSENTAESARLLAPDLLIIHGRFRPDVQGLVLPFVQMRVKQGDEWLLKELWIFLTEKE
jgi:ketosteroid isomerase-like protein